MVAITGGATRRPSWHWRVSVFKRRTAFRNGLTLGQPAIRRAALYTSERNSQRLCAKAVTITAFRTAIREIESTALDHGIGFTPEG